MIIELSYINTKQELIKNIRSLLEVITFAEIQFKGDNPPCVLDALGLLEDLVTALVKNETNESKEKLKSEFVKKDEVELFKVNETVNAA